MNTQTQSELLRLSELCASNQKSEILHNLNLTMNVGEIHAVVSTSEFYLQSLLDAMAGRISITSGDMYFLGGLIAPQKLVEDRISFVCQETRLFNGFTAINNIYINDKSFYRLSNSKKKELATQMQAMFGLDIDLNQDVFLLTAEERKMVEVLRAYQMNPQLVVLHDTFNFVNIEYIGALKRILRRMAQDGKGVLYATTNLEDALNFSMRISILDKGYIKGVFDTDQAINNPREIMRRISGWDSLDAEAAEETGMSAKMYDALVRSREIITSSVEIKHVIHALSIDFRQALSADGCVIYLVDDEVNGIIDSIYAEEALEAPRLTNAYICSCAQDTECIQISDTDPGFTDIFVAGGKGARTLLCASVFSSNKQIGFIQIWYRKQEVFKAKRFRYIGNFAREVAIAVETSRLMGYSVLLQESHHRIKNNLQVIINLVYMQKASLLRDETQQTNVNVILDSVIERVKSIAAVHDMFSSNKLGESTVNFRLMIQKLLKMYDVTSICFQMEVDDIGIPYSKATSIALVVNELLSNCFKHAFPDGWDDRRVLVRCCHDGNDILLCVEDSGIGLPAGFDPTACDSLGISIIQSIVESIYGSLIYRSKNGTRAELRIPTRKLYN